MDPASVVLIRRGNPPNAGLWSLPGGRVERGELLSAAAQREVREETGLEVEIGSLIEVVELIGEEHHYVVHDYVARPRGPLSELRAGDDAMEVRIVPVAELASYGVTELVMKVVRSALEAS